jgi:uncharacterized protein (UPF0548 family)
VFLRSKPSNAAIREFLARQAQSRFSYSTVGCSVSVSAPGGYVIDHNRALLGHGERVWQRAVQAIHDWRMFNMDWLQLCWPDVPITAESNVAVLVRHFGFWSLNAARIAYVINQNDGLVKRYGFAYGTLLDHSESGEERFSVEWHTHDDTVWYDLWAYSRPGTLAAWLGYPFSRRLQHRFQRDSKAAMARAVAENGPKAS